MGYGRTLRGHQAGDANAVGGQFAASAVGELASLRISLTRGRQTCPWATRDRIDLLQDRILSELVLQAHRLGLERQSPGDPIEDR